MPFLGLLAGISVKGEVVSWVVGGSGGVFFEPIFQTKAKERTLKSRIIRNPGAAVHTAKELAKVVTAVHAQDAHSHGYAAMGMNGRPL